MLHQEIFPDIRVADPYFIHETFFEICADIYQSSNCNIIVTIII